MGSGFGTLRGRKKSESPAPERSDPRIGTPPIARGRTWGNRAQRGFAKFGRFAPPTPLSGSACEGKSRAHARIFLNSLKCPTIERLVGGCRSLLRTVLRLEFPDHQGKYREFCRFAAILN